MSNNTLYEIREELMNFEMEIDPETGEVLNALELDALEMERNEKRENIALFIKNLSADVDALKAEKQAFDERIKAKERKIAWLTVYLQYDLAGEKFETARCAISYRKSERVEIEPFVNIDSKWCKVKYEPDKTLIKKAIKDGEVIEGAQIVECQNMIIK